MIITYEGKTPVLHDKVRVMNGAYVIGDAVIGEGSSIWFNSVVRADVNSIRIGRYVNIQDLCVVHCTKELYSATIGDMVTVGHRSIIHGCRIGDNSLIGMGAVIMDGSVIGKNCIVGGGSVVLEGSSFPPGALIAGAPAKVKRELTKDEIMNLPSSAAYYHILAGSYPEKE